MYLPILSTAIGLLSAPFSQHYILKYEIGSAAATSAAQELWLKNLCFTYFRLPHFQLQWLPKTNDHVRWDRKKTIYRESTGGNCLFQAATRPCVERGLWTEHDPRKILWEAPGDGEVRDQHVHVPRSLWVPTAWSLCVQSLVWPGPAGSHFCPSRNFKR